MEVVVVVVVVGETSEAPKGRARISWNIFSLFLGKRNCETKIDSTTAKRRFCEFGHFCTKIMRLIKKKKKDKFSLL